ncbi:hypothetical protein ACN93C_004587 [Vibrio parahaemolyticus]
MDISLWVKIPALVSAFILLSKFLLELASGKHARLKDDYRFSKEFLSDIAEGKLHPYAVEKGYQAIAGTENISVKEVEYILTLENSTKCLRDYVLSKQYLKKLELHGALTLEFEEKYSSSFSRNWRKYLYASLYFLLAFIACPPLFIDGILGISKVQSFLLFGTTLAMFGFPAWLSLKAFARIKRGEELVKSQSKYTPSIILQT